MERQPSPWRRSRYRAQERLLDALETLPVVGGLYRKLQRRLFFRHVKWLRIQAGNRVAAASANTIKSGVFAGMKIQPQSARGKDRFTILTGQYERELYEIVSSAAARNYEAFINIGCASGFYAIGFAMISEGTDITAYDTSESARRTTRSNAQLNGVADRLTIKGEPDHSELQSTISRYREVFILADIEGAELFLLDPEKCPALRACDLLVELHGQIDQAAAELTERFKATHHGSPIARAARNPFAVDLLSCEFEDEAWVTISEGRGCSRNNWLLLTRLTSPDPATAR